MFRKRTTYSSLSVQALTPDVLQDLETMHDSGWKMLAVIPDGDAGKVAFIFSKQYRWEKPQIDFPITGVMVSSTGYRMQQVARVKMEPGSTITKNRM